MKFTHVKILIRRSFIFHPIPMTFWLKTPNNIYKNWLNSHIDRIMFTVSKLEIKKVKIVLEHPVYVFQGSSQGEHGGGEGPKIKIIL